MALPSAMVAILLWSSLATLGVSLAGVPPLLLIGTSLCVGGLLSVPWARNWTLRWQQIAIGCYGMLLYHLLFVLALRNAPPVSANLVHYTWPMLIVVLSPVFSKGMRLRRMHVLCAVTGFAGAALAIVGDGASARMEFRWGYVYALGAALVWSTYSLHLARVDRSSSADVGLACLISGAAALLVHATTEPSFELTHAQLIGLVALGIGPMGLAFYLWSLALKKGDPRVIGVLANATPLLSTAFLALSGNGKLSGSSTVAAVLVSVSSLAVLLVNARAFTSEAEKFRSM